MTKISLSLVLILILCAFTTGNHKSFDYYVNPRTGNDSNTGTTPEHAWKSLQRISQQRLKAGDQILLSGSHHFQGSLKLAGLEGTKESPIVITSFGKGQAIIASGDSVGILAQNCKYLKISNIHVSGAGRLKGNETHGIELVQCHFSEIDSVLADGFLYSGIRISGGSDIRIIHSRAYDNGFCGINVESDEKVMDSDVSSNRTMKRLYIGYCIAENNPGCIAIKNNHSGNGILAGHVTSGLIEYCEAMNNGWDMPRKGNGPVGIWAYMCDSITIQHCYSHHNKTADNAKDGGGFDFDGGVRYSVMQYNLSAFNEGAGYGIFQYAGASQWTDNVVRYNISYHDGSKNGHCGISVWSDPAAEPMSNFHAYNNTIVNNYGQGFYFEPGAYKNFLFENNIIQITVKTDAFIKGKFTLATFDKNLYWCSYNSERGIPQPTVYFDKNALFADPNLVMPDSGQILLQNSNYPPGLKFFKINESSVCKKAGKKIAKNGGKDFWKNPILPDIYPNIGAFQGK